MKKFHEASGAKFSKKGSLIVRLQLSKQERQELLIQSLKEKSRNILHKASDLLAAYNT